MIDMQFATFTLILMTSALGAAAATRATISAVLYVASVLGRSHAGSESRLLFVKRAR
jgi:hypothetical protein